MCLDNPFIDAIWDSAPLAILILNAEGRIEEANTFASELIGESLGGRLYSDLLVDFLDNPGLDILASSPQKTHLIQFSGSGRLPVPLLCHLFKKEAQYLLIGYIDYHEMNVLRKQLFSLNHELNNLTRELHKKNAELKRLNDLKNQFLGMAAHDLRKPTGIILNYSEFLLEDFHGTINEESGQFLIRIRDLSQHMRQLINDFLDVSMIEAGKFDLALQQSDLISLVRQTFDMNTMLARKKQIHIAMENETDSLLLMMDSSKMEQALNNLIQNAIEHSHEKGEIIVSTRSDADQIQISIRDHGVGMSPDKLKKLFHPFSGAVSRKTGGEKSTGLGLVISKKIIEAHQGIIQVESKIGEGSLVTVILPKRLKEDKS
ncbi:hypothetical protein EH221_00250 [bacterium]|nr:MAG: hypothetical protein EH221_00250 [bacterium]